MRLPLLLCAPLALLLCVSLGSADLVEPRKFDPEKPPVIVPMSAHSYIGAFNANEPAQAQVSGSGKSCLGLYVFDAHGNCVALDDRTAPQSGDDLGVESIPSAAARYSVVVRNAGPDENTYRLAIR